MCHEWWTLRREREQVEEGHRVWDLFERERPATPPEPVVELGAEDEEPAREGTGEEVRAGAQR